MTNKMKCPLPAMHSPFRYNHCACCLSHWNQRNKQKWINIKKMLRFFSIKFFWKPKCAGQKIKKQFFRFTHRMTHKRTVRRYIIINKQYRPRKVSFCFTWHFRWWFFSFYLLSMFDAIDISSIHMISVPSTSSLSLKIENRCFSCVLLLLLPLLISRSYFTMPRNVYTTNNMVKR